MSLQALRRWIARHPLSWVLGLALALGGAQFAATAHEYTHIASAAASSHDDLHAAGSHDCPTCLLAAALGSIAILLVSLFHPTFLPFLAAMCVFLLGMGIVNPLGTAQALSPFGEKAGAASALLGFWQMMGAAIGVWLAATVSHEAMFALGIVLTVASVLALGLYAMRAKAN